MWSFSNASPVLGKAPRTRTAFTLIELLVVIAIIAILAAILFPVFAQARAKARQTACLSNMKQIGTSLMMYAQDYDEMYPFSRSYGPNTSVGLPVLLSSYIQKVNNTVGGSAVNNSNPGIWKCPSDSNAARTSTAQGTPPAGVVLQRQTYSPVFWFDNARAAWNNDTDMGGGNYAALGRSLAAFQAPANTFVIAELTAASNILGYNFIGVRRPWVETDSGFGGGQNCTSNSESSEVCTSVLSTHGLHNSGWNYVYADGHVKWSKPESTVGRGVSGNGKDAAGNTCNNRTPCGAWTMDADD